MLKIVEAYDRRPIAEVETEGADALEVKLEKAARCFRDRDQWLGAARVHRSALSACLAYGAPAREVQPADRN